MESHTPTAYAVLCCTSKPSRPLLAQHAVPEQNPYRTKPYHPTKIQGNPCVCMGRLSTAQLAPHHKNQALPSSGLPSLMKCPLVKNLTKPARSMRALNLLAGPACSALSSPKSQPAHIGQQARLRDATLDGSASSAKIIARSFKQQALQRHTPLNGWLPWLI